MLFNLTESHCVEDPFLDGFNWPSTPEMATDSAVRLVLEGAYPNASGSERVVVAFNAASECGVALEARTKLMKHLSPVLGLSPFVAASPSIWDLRVLPSSWSTSSCLFSSSRGLRRHFTFVSRFNFRPLSLTTLPIVNL